ncbi:MAG: NAD(P)-dependent alcohol dehydrogenase [Chthoniobacter sp.]|uniref:NADPH-dependent aldehyde reductase Ahr n=1 Tax=Chthoniobacter sp. TaxID=2510640 RepID=UPI0032ACD36F
MSTTIKAYAATSAKSPLTPFEYSPGPLGDEQVDVAVSYCGVCHSDLSMLDNEWGMSVYPLVGGHEVVGKVVAIGDQVKNLKVGQVVGVGWYSGSCMSCRQCMGGDHNLCVNAEGTIVHRHGGFGTQVRAHWAWTTPLPEGLDPAKAGPLFCGGITVFNPIVQFGVKPTDRVGVVGIGGLGHMALKFLHAWGCDVVAFTSSDSKRDEALQLGANSVVNSRNGAEMEKLAGSFNFILSTVNVKLDWPAYINALAPKGRLHTVGAIAEPVSLAAFPLIVGQRSFSGSPLGSPVTTAMMLDFAARHDIAPTTELFPMSKINDAFEHLKSGKARYRIVLENDLN